ncbi:hypothetical protein NIES2101_35060 [Calothrix sp. HK-06]|nr:hypothetical protein NIES2101_35060 [Calothrix sp. HK-06]
MKKKVNSFDVFETAIVRIWARPTDLFWELGNHLKQENLIQISPELWHKIRSDAEWDARKKTATGEVSLKDIYQKLALSLGWSNEQVERAMHKEIALEVLSLRPVPANQRKIQALQKTNARIIYMSDMYLSEAIIQDFLVQNNVWAPGSKLYVSSEIGASKSTGKLFRHCLKQESVKPSELLHIGDNFRGDVKKAKQQGVRVEPFTQTHLNRYERMIAEEPSLPLRFRSLLAGMSRLTRLQSQQTTPDQQVIWETTASVIAPLLFGFVHSCLEQAQEKGLKRLYFAARDGQILQKIAQVICKNWGYQIDCRYLYGSRQAWHLPAIEEIGEVELDWILARTNFLSIRSICKRVNISPEQIQDVLSHYGFLAAKWDTNLPEKEQNLLREIFTHKQVTELIISTAVSYREKVIGYFYQEGLGDGVPFGFVDVGWVGRIQRSFSRLLNTAGLYPESGINGFYFALEQRVKPFKNDKLLAYFYDVEKPCDRNLIFKYRHLFELFVSADHGSTVSYEQRGKEYVPVLRSPKNEKAINWGLYTLQEATVEFAKQLTANLGKQDFSIEEFLKSADFLAKELVHNPSPQEAKAFGTFTISGDQTESMMSELAPVYKITDWWRFLISGKHPHADVWHPGSIARSNLIVRALLGPKTINKIREIRKNLAKQKHINLSEQFSQPI